MGVTFKVFNFKNYLSEPDEYVRWVNAGENVPRVPSTILGSGTSMIYNPR